MPKERTREKFVQLAEARTIKAIKAIRLLGNLSNKSNYKYEPEDVQKILKALDYELKSLKARFESKDSRNDIDFKL